MTENTIATVTTESAKTDSAAVAVKPDDKLETFFFMMTDGTIAGVKAHSRLEAVRILRGR